MKSQEDKDKVEQVANKKKKTSYILKKRDAGEGPSRSTFQRSQHPPNIVIENKKIFEKMNTNSQCSPFANQTN